MVKAFEKIVVPNPEKGLSNKQRDRLDVDVANVVNYLGESMKEINGDVKKLDKEIYGDKEYEGLKSMTHSNSRWVNILVKTLIIGGIIGGTGLGFMTVTGG